MIKSDRPFAILTSVSLLPEIARGTLKKDGYDEDIQRKVNGMTKLVMASTADVWLVNIPGMAKQQEVLLMEVDEDNSIVLHRDGPSPAQQTGCTQGDALQIMTRSRETFIEQLNIFPRDEVEPVELFVQTRSQKSSDGGPLSDGLDEVTKSHRVSRKDWPSGQASPGATQPNTSKKRKRTHSHAATLDSQFTTWVGKQEVGQNIPQGIMRTVISPYEGHPEGLKAIPSSRGGPPRIIVPLKEQSRLVNEVHKEIHHQGHKKVHHILEPLFYWPGMDRFIEAVCTSCNICIRAKRRRLRLNSAFSPNSAGSTLLPRESYGISF